MFFAIGICTKNTNLKFLLLCDKLQDTKTALCDF